MTPPVLRLCGIHRRYPLPRTRLFGPRPVRQAVRGVDLEIGPGESVGLVGESGSGKSTLGRIAAGLEPPDAGRMELMGRDPAGLSRRQRRALQRHVQMVFQDPYGSLDPRQKIGRIVAEPLALLDVSGNEAAARVATALAAVGLRRADMDRYPHEFSGGQRQRIAIARALVIEPSLVIADEPVSALDVSVQAQVLALMADLRARLGLAYLFISHDLGVVAHVTERLLVMQEGRIVEQGPTERVLRDPRHPYTRELLEAHLPPDPVRARARLRAVRQSQA